MFTEITRALLFLSLFTVGSVACGASDEEDHASSEEALSLVRDPTITPREGRIVAVSTRGIEMVLRVDALNPNFIGVTARSVTAKVTLDDRLDLGTIVVPRDVPLPAHTTTSIEVPLSIPWRELPSVIRLAASRSDVPYAVECTVAIGAAALSLQVPFKLDGTITHAQLVDATKASLPGLP